MTYRRRASPLHAARAGVGSLYCVVLAGVALSFEHPLLLGAVLLAVVLAAAGAGVGDVVARSLLWGLPFALLIAVVNALVVREGLTVIWRFGELPPFGAVDVTLEATTYGAHPRPARADRHRLLRAALGRDRPRRAAARVPPAVVPLRADGGARDADGAGAGARRAALPRRPALPPGRARLAARRSCAPSRPARSTARSTSPRRSRSAATAGAGGRRAGRGRGRGTTSPSPLSAGALAALGIAAAVLGWEPFEAYPRTLAPVDAGVVALAVALVACALLPFADRRGIGR